jgi:hypothetical protein
LFDNNHLFLQFNFYFWSCAAFWLRGRKRLRNDSKGERGEETMKKEVSRRWRGEIGGRRGYYVAAKGCSKTIDILQKDKT